MDWSFGITTTIAGMGVTLITLYILTLVIRFLNKRFPFKEESKESDQDQAS